MKDGQPDNDRMTWVRVDDGAPNHPKNFRAGVAAFGFDVAGICYCNRNLTDGVIPVSDLPLVFPGVTPRVAIQLATKLVEAGRWTKTETGYQVHDYHHYNPTAAEVRGDRERARQRMSERRSQRTPQPVRQNTQENIVGTAPELQPPRPVPSRPDPEQQGGEGADGAAPPGPPPVFKIPASIDTALNRAPTLGRVPRLREPSFWQAQVRSRPGVNFAAQILEAETWLVANPKRAPKNDFPAFLNRWLRKAHEDLKA